MGVVSHELLQTRFPQPLEEIKAQLLSAEHWEGEVTHTRRDGAPLTVASRWTLERDGANQPVAIIEINYDITDRKNYEQALQDKNAELELANRELEAFSYSVSHDLRSPLRAVDGFSQAVLEDYGKLLPDQGGGTCRPFARGRSGWAD
jgi:signal transduction histidine kinase